MKSNFSKLKQNSRVKGSITRNRENFFEEADSEQLWSRDQLQKNSYSKSQMYQRKQITDVDYFLEMFTAHYTITEECFKKIEIEMTKLESKIAQCYGKFNQIEWKLNRQMHEISQAKTLNESLLGINREVEQKLAMVKKDYEQLKNKKYISSMQKKLDELKECVHNWEMQNYKSKFNQHKTLLLEDSIDRLQQILNKGRKQGCIYKQVYCQIIQDLIGFIKSKSQISQWINQKVQENIKLKLKFIKGQTNISEED